MWRHQADITVRWFSANLPIKRALASADVPAMLEPCSLSRDDGKRPDGLTIMPWANGRCLVLMQKTQQFIKSVKGV